MITRGRGLNRRGHRLAESDEPFFLTIEGSPEAVKHRNMYSDREAMIGGDHFEALDGEETDDFHDRLQRIAKERGVKIIGLGHPSNRAASEAFWNAQEAKEGFAIAIPPVMSADTAPQGSKLN